MIRGNNDGKATNSSLSASAQTPHPAAPTQFLPLQSLQSPFRLPQPQQQQIVHIGSAQQVVRPISVAAITAAVSAPSQTLPSVVQNVNVVAIQTSPSTIEVVAGSAPTPTTACISHVAQSPLATTPAAVQQYVLTGSHQVSTATPTSTVPSKLQPSALCAVVTDNGGTSSAGLQQTLYTVGSTSSLARILASTQGYIQVRYENPITAVANSSGTVLQTAVAGKCAGSSSNVLRTVATSVAGVTLASIPSHTTPETSRATVHHLAASTTETWARPTTPATGFAVKMLPHVTTYQQEGSTDHVISRTDPIHLHSYTAPICTSVSGSSHLSLQNPATAASLPCRTLPSVVQEHVAGLLTSPPPPPPPPLPTHTFSQHHQIHDPVQARSLNPISVGATAVQQAPCVQSSPAHFETNVAPTTVVSASPANIHKRLKLEPKPAATPEIAGLRSSVLDHHWRELQASKEAYSEHVTELYFLQNGHNFTDYLTWKKRANPQLLMYLRTNAIDSDDEETQTLPPLLSSPSSTFTGGAFPEVKIPSSGGTPVAVSTSLPIAITQITQQGTTSGANMPKGGRHGMVFGNHHLPFSSTVTSLSILPGGTPHVTDLRSPTSTSSHTSALPSPVTGHPSISAIGATRLGHSPHSGNRQPSLLTAVTSSATNRSPGSMGPLETACGVGGGAAVSGSSIPANNKGGRSPSFALSSPARLQTRQHSISAVYDSTIGSQEEIVERAKQEAHVIQRIAELRKDGLWSEKRLPKVQEPQRNKAHWDYLLEEMVWLATDFAQERKWKKAAAKKCARMCQKYHQEQKLKEERAEREAEQKLKRIASTIAKEIKQFWTSVEKFVEYKQQSRLDLKRKKVLDLHLNFIVDQTEKYSSWVAQGMSKSSTQNSVGSSTQISRASTPASDSASDEDFHPFSEDSDDEETIAKAEENIDEEARKTEVELLEKESLVPLEDLLKDLPREILEKPASVLREEEEEEDEDEDEDDEGELRNSETSSVESKVEGRDKSKGDHDDEFVVSSEEEGTDDEVTIKEQEVLEKDIDHSQELMDLKHEGELSLEELVQKYSGAYDSDFEMAISESEDSSSLSEDSDGNEESELESEVVSDISDSDEMMDIGIESLIHPEVKESFNMVGSINAPSNKGPSQEITDIAAAAESFKPKGYTYSTAQVATKVPFLLKHQLREYQHIGLDWLVTMYERKLNGILADEMGLGKTIQTIALLAHLACEKGNWGPHLIVVPTSVMLNWEMEFKKWCPAFKILTYYGSQKERKQKRQGWTKPNTFHICITSYKLVIQDHQSFRRKKWKYFILDEAQNIKNFKSQRWQLLLNFQSQRRLLLTGTPLQNNLMELWSLMHFLMPNVFQSHRDFKEWFANPVSGMIEGSHEYNKELINRLHKVLRPFLLRRLKSEVEKQLPRKFEHVVLCRLSKRQRYLYEDFMSQTKTKETLASGNFMSVINVLMQLRKVCNHPNLFEARPTVSPFQMDGICYYTASLAYKALEYDPFKNVDLFSLNLLLADLELCLTAFAAHRIKKFQTPKRLIEEIDTASDPPPKCPPGKIKLHVRTTSSSSAQKVAVPPSAGSFVQVKAQTTLNNSVAATVTGVQAKTISTSPLTTVAATTSSSSSSITLPVSVSVSSIPAATTSTVSTTTAPTTQTQSHPLSGYTFQLVQQPSQGAVSVAQLSGQPLMTSTPITVQIQHTNQGPRLTVPSGQLSQIPAGFAQLVQTSTGQHILLTSTPQTILQPSNAVHNVTIGQGMTAAPASANRMTVTLSSLTATQAANLSQPIVSLPRLQVQSATASSVVSTSSLQPSVAKVAPVTASVSSITKVGAVTVPLSSKVSPISAPTSSVAKMFAITPTVASVGKVASVTTTTSLVMKTSSVATSSVVKPVVRVAPMNIATSTTSVSTSSAPLTIQKPTMIVPSTEDGASLPTRPVTRSNTKVDEKKSERCGYSQSLFHLEALKERRYHLRKERLEMLAKFNTRRCEACPIYGSDLIKAVTVVEDTHVVGPSWKGMGYVQCLNAVELSSHPKHYWNQTYALSLVVNTPESLLLSLSDILSRFVFVVPTVMTPQITMYVSHPPPSRLVKEVITRKLLRTQLSPRVACLHSIASGMATQFPDPRLIQYDCGKLQTLDQLLRQLKSNGRRVLIFTQMTRMLDVLEQFLNYHGHIYLRLDGTTKVEQRQALMERFNADLRIFCFILSTRSGGIGVNLTGADTVIFYDSDWNPTMDAQAQDRCHRIGQTRDVHIYRLISERTVEENILKKANQKRLLGEVAIEGGNFTTAFFKKHTIQELFDVDFDSLKKLPLVKIREEPDVEDTVSSAEGNLSTIQLEHALANAEEDTDVQAAKNAKKEADLELAEFDESIPYDGDGIRDEESFKVEEELGAMIAELTPVQRYAMNFLESTQEPFSLEQLKQAEEEIEAQKKDWELGRLQAMREEEERRAQLEDNDLPYTYAREDANQIYISYNTGEQMPIWAPPTPPQDKSDVYLDYSTCFLYEPNAMPESQLPPVFVKKEHKRSRVDAATAANVRKQKLRKEESINIPRSLFDRPSAAILKMRRDVKLQKGNAGNRLPTMSVYKPPAVINKPIIDTHQDTPEWLIHEDWALLQALQTLLELPLNLLVLSPAHTPNWDLVADVVNSTSRMYRSAKQCKTRYESVIIPREEGKILYDTNPKKQKKSKGIYRTKNNRPMRTSQLFLQDNNSSYSALHHQRYDTIKAVANKRTPTLRPPMVNQAVRNPKHAAVLAENGINYEQPLTPVQVATNRSDRISREKLKNQVMNAEQLAVQQQQLQQQQQRQQQQVQSVSSQLPSQQPATAQAVIGLTSGQMTAQQLQSVIGRMAVAAPGLSGTTGIVTTAGSGNVRAQRAATALVMQDILGGVTPLRNVAPQAVVSMASLAPTQVSPTVATQQRVASVTPITSGTAVTAQGTTALAAKGLTAAQLQLLRTHQSMYNQKRLQVAQQQAAQVAVQQQPKVSVAVTSLLSPSVASMQVSQSQQRSQGVKQTVTRTMTEVEVAQLIKRQQQIQQQQKVAGQVQVPVQSQLSSQLLAQAQLQQQTANPASLTTLVKTVSTPSSLGTASPSVTIPVSAVGMPGVNISVSLPQVKGAVGTAKVVTPQQQQLQQLKLLHQRKQQQLQLQQQQKLAQAKAHLGTVQIMQQAQPHKNLPATVTVQQIQQVIKQVQPQALQHLTQVSSSGSVAMTQAAAVQALSHAVLSKTGQTTIAAPTTVTAALHAAAVQGHQTLHTRVIPVAQSIGGISSPTLTQNTTSALKQTIQVVAATPATAQAHLRGQSLTTAQNVTIDASGLSQAIIGHAGVPIATAAFSTPVTHSQGVTTGIKVRDAAGQQQQQQQQPGNK